MKPPFEEVPSQASPAGVSEVDRRTFLTGLTAVGITASAGCVDTVSELAGSFGRDAGGTVREGSETFEFEADAGETIVVRVSVDSQGTGSGDLRLAGPDGVIEERGALSLRSDTRFDREAESDGLYELSVNAANAELDVSVSLT